MSFFRSMGWTIISFLIFTVLVAAISAWKTRGDDLKSANGFFLAGNSLPGIVIAGSLLLTNLSAEQLVGTNGQSWASNMSPIGWEVGSMVALIALGLFFLPRYLKMGTPTIPSLLEQRYGKSTKIVFSLVMVITYSILNLPVILYSGAVVFENIFGVSDILGISTFQAIALLCILIGFVGACYAIAGGLKAVAVSDTINGIGLLIGGLMVPFLGLFALGRETGGSGIIDGWQFIVESDPEKLNSLSAWNAGEPEVPWPLIFTGMLFNNLFFWCTNQSIIQRSLGAKSLKEGQKGAILCGFLKCLGPLYLVLPGVIAYYLPSIQDKIAAAGDSAIDIAYPALITAIIPKPVLGFFAAVLFGAILSSFNSVLNSASTMFSLDLYREIKPDASDEKCVKVGRTFGTFIAVISVIIAPFIMYANGITTFLNSMFQFLGMPLLCSILGMFLFRHLPKYTPKLILVFHVILYGIFLFVEPCYPGTDTPVHYLYAVAVLFGVEMLIMALLNRFRPQSETFEITDKSIVDMTPWKYRYVVSVIGIVLAVGIYLFFSPLGIAA